MNIGDSAEDARKDRELPGGEVPDSPPEIDAQASVSPPVVPVTDASGNKGRNNLGGALRTAYQSMVEEAIPPEMLDLLNRLK
ncbi:NepR family anti-sigma factor [Sphingobium subterraneum]|uniref:NepR family anti-sigma factor n=1 Tax=Sphingobium subterraneum TaxID=627688 RepID=UPI001C84F62E|nr:NepR family anti-sigma factor [Sphingobium subterraneum]